LEGRKENEPKETAFLLLSRDFSAPLGIAGGLNNFASLLQRNAKGPNEKQVSRMG